MPTTATTLEELVREVYLADTDLIAFMNRPASTLVNGVPGGGWTVGDFGWYFPQMGVSPDGDTQTPFIIQRFRGLGGRFVYYTGWTTTVYDSPDKGYHRINEVLHILRMKFSKEFWMPDSVQGYEWFRSARHEYSISNQVDPEWSLNSGFVRMSSHAI